MHLDDLIVKSNIRNYTVHFQENEDFIENLSKIENAVFVVDKKVYDLYKKSFLSVLPIEKVIIQESLEQYKNIDTVCYIYEKIMSFAPRKNMTLISIGGGIIQDITGFVASTLYRGIKWIFVPTTLLAQVDSCIGAKTSLNFKHYKNLVGSFFPPNEIYLFPEFLKTLSKDDFYSGVGEMAKLHLMDGQVSTCIFKNNLELIDQRDNEVLLQSISKCLSIKKNIIEDDEFDTGRRNLLNYGHCFGHAIESSTNFLISHGQAVVLGMILANKVALNKGVLSKKMETYIYDEILTPILKVNIPKIDIELTVKAMRQDKKNIGKGLALIMLLDNYEMTKVVDMTEEEAIAVLKNI